jgi:hypothetical protein
MGAEAVAKVFSPKTKTGRTALFALPDPLVIDSEEALNGA